jgi:cyclomaltodextrinase
VLRIASVAATCCGTLKDVATLAVGALDFSDSLYLHPIYPAMSYHRYDVVNHMDVDERLGAGRPSSRCEMR